MYQIYFYNKTKHTWHCGLISKKGYLQSYVVHIFQLTAVKKATPNQDTSKNK